MKQESKNKSRLLKAGILAMLLGMSGGTVWAGTLPEEIDTIQGKLPSGYTATSGVSDYGWTMVGKAQQVRLQNSSALGFQNLIEDWILLDEKGNKVKDDEGNDVHGSGSTAIGTQNKIYESSDATVVGKENTSTGVQNSLFGSGNTVTSQLSVAVGTWNNIKATTGAFAFGVSNTVSQSNALAVGFENTVSGNTSGGTAIGVKNSTTANNAVAMGFMSSATGKGAYALGTGFSVTKGQIDGSGDGKEMVSGVSTNRNLASGENSVAVGWANNATGEAAIAIGSAVANTTASTTKVSDGVYKLTNSDGRTVNLQQKASAQGSIALGIANQATAKSAVAIGDSNEAKGQNSLAIGGYLGTSGKYTNGENGVANTAVSMSSIAVGLSNYAEGNNSVTIGTANKTNGKGAIAIGTGDASETAINARQTATGTYAQVIGAQNTANGNYTLAYGYANKVYAGTDAAQTAVQNAIAIGSENTSGAARTTTVGYHNKATSADAVAIGAYNVASGVNALAIGYGDSDTEGQQQEVSGTYAQGVGFKNTVAGARSLGYGYVNETATDASGAVTFGTANKATKTGAIAIGSGTLGDDGKSVSTAQLAGGEYAIAVGYANTANSNYSQAIGSSNAVYGANSIAYGFTNTVGTASMSSSNAVALGAYNAVRASSAIAIGSGTKDAPQTASGTQAIALGYQNTAAGHFSQSIGNNNVIQSNAYYYSQAIGYENTISAARALGYGAKNTASELDAVTFGTGNEASGVGAIAIGSGKVTKVAGADWYFSIAKKQKASGQYSIALGAQNQSVAGFSVSVGYGNETEEVDVETSTGTTVKSTNAIAMGALNRASGQNAISIGAGTGISTDNPTYQVAEGTNAIAIGNINNATADSSFAIGTANTAAAENALALGGENLTDAYASMAFGLNNYVRGDGKKYDEDNPKGENSTKIYGSMAQGMNNKVFGMNSIAMGSGNTIGTYVTNSDGSYDAKNSVNSDVTLAFGVGNTARIGSSNVLTLAQKAVENGELKFNDVVELVKLYSNGDTTFEATVDAIKEGKDAYAALTTDKLKMDALVNAVQTAYDTGDDVTKDLITKATNWDGHGLLIGENNEVYGAKSLGFGTENKVYSIGSIVVGGSNEVGASDKDENERDFLSMAIGTKNKIQGSLNVVMGIANESYGNQTISVGSNTIGESDSTVQNGIAYGINNKVYSDKSVAIGGTNKVNAQAGTGTSLTNPTTTETIEAGQSLALGLGNTVNTSQAIVIGGANTVGTATDTATTVAANDAVTLSGREVVIGVGSTIAANAGQSTALGGANTVSAANSVALGFGSMVAGTNSVALGAGSSTTADQYDTVSVGGLQADGSVLRRQIVNVAYGQDKYDAAAYGQIAKTGQKLNFSSDSTSQKITANDGDITIATINIKNGKVEAGDTGFTSGDTVYWAIKDMASIVDYDKKYKANGDHYLSTDFNQTFTKKGTDSAAYGYNANAQGDNSVAIGSGSVATEAYTFAVGSSDNKRRIVNVAAATKAGEATVYEQIAAKNQIVSGKDITEGSTTQSNIIKDNAGNTLVTIKTYDASKPSTEDQSDAYVTYGNMKSSIINIVEENSIVDFDKDYENSGKHWLSTDFDLDIDDSTKGRDSTAYGYGAQAQGANSVALGAGSVATADNVVSFGNENLQRKLTNVAYGSSQYDAATYGQILQKSAEGTSYVVDKDHNTVELKANDGTTLATIDVQFPEYDPEEAVDPFLQRSDENHWIDVKWNNKEGSTVVRGENSVALGYQANAQGNNSVALGYGSIATEANTFSVGSAESQRKIVNVANGTENTDAATYGQLVDAQLQENGSYKVYEADDDGVVTVLTNGGDVAFKIAGGSGGSGTSIVDYDKNYGSTEGDHWLSTDFGNKANVDHGDDSTAYGYGANAKGDQSVALGKDAVAEGAGSIAIGEGSSAKGTSSIALGEGASVTGSNSVAIGDGSQATGDNEVSFGTSDSKRKLTNVSEGTASGDVAVYDQIAAKNQTVSGANITTGDRNQTNVIRDNAGNVLVTIATADPDGAVNKQGDKYITEKYFYKNMEPTIIDIVEENSIVDYDKNYKTSGNHWLSTDFDLDIDDSKKGRDSTAYGYGAQAQGANSVALGSGSVATADNVVSFGNENLQRKLTNVAYGSSQYDAATYGQILQKSAEGTSYVVDKDHNTVELKANDGTTLATIDVQFPEYDPEEAVDPFLQRSDTNHWIDVKWNNKEGATVVRGENSVALGYQANAQGNNSVALGYGSIATEANTFSVGSAESQRKIVNVANGTENTDAATYGQLADAQLQEDGSYKVYKADNDGVVTVFTNDGDVAFKIEGGSGSGTALPTGQKVSFSDTTTPEEGAEDTRTNVIRDKDDNVIAEFEAGKVEKDNTGFVSGGDVWNNIAAKDQTINGANNKLMANDGTTVLATIASATDPTDQTTSKDSFTTKEYVDKVITDHTGTTLAEDQHISFTDTTVPEEGAEDTRTNVIRDVDGKALVTIDKGAVEKDNKNLVDGGTVYDAIAAKDQKISGTNNIIKANDGTELATIETADSTVINKEGDKYITEKYYYDTINNIVQENSIVDYDPNYGTTDGDHWLSTDFGKENVEHGKDSTAYGYGANAKGDESTAIGKDAVAEGKGSVAIGEGSIAKGDNEVSFGTEDNKRKLTNVAEGEKLGDVAVYDQIAAKNQTLSGDNNKLMANDGTTVLATIKTYDSSKTDRENKDAFVTYDTIKDTIDHTVAPDQVVSFDNTTDGNPGQTNVIRGEDGKVLVTIKKGDVAKGDTGLVSGGDVYNADVAKNQLIYATTAARSDDATKQQNIIYDNLGNKLATMQIGEVTSGSTGFVSGGQVYNADVKNLTYEVEYAWISEDHDDGAVGTVIVKNNKGDTAFTITGIQTKVGEDLKPYVPYTGDGKTIHIDPTTKVVSGITTDEITEGGEKLVTAGTIYNEDRKAIVEEPVTYNIKNQSVGDNLVALDTALGKISEGSPDNTDPDKKTYYTISSGDSISENIEKIDAALKETDGLIKLSDDKKQILVGSGDNAAYATTVSFANNTGEARRLTDVAAGKANTDAANVGQLLGGGTYNADTKTITFTNKEGDTAFSIEGIGGASEGELVKKGQTVSLKNTTGDDATKTNVLRAQDGSVLATFEKGEIKENNTGFVSGGDVYAAIAAKDQTIDGKNNQIVSNDGTVLATIKTYDKNKTAEENKNAFVTIENIDQSVTYIVNENSIVDFDKNAKGNPDGDHWVSTDFGATDVTHGKDSTAYGYGSNAKGDISTALGYKNTVEKTSSTAVGANNTVSGAHSIAAGCDNDVQGDYAVALGHNNKVTGNNAIVIGKDGTAGKDGIVLGNNSSAAEGSTAIGGNSVAKDKDEVSFGHSKGDTAPDGTTYDSDLNRKLTHVADGSSDNDAANMGQLNEVKKKVDGFDSRISGVEDSMGKGIAGASALAALHPLEFDPDDKASFAVGYGHFNSSDALALGAFYRPNESVLFSVGGVLGNGENQLNAGISFALGRDDKRTHPMGRVEMSRRIQNLQQENAGLNERIDRLERFIAQMVANGQPQQEEQAVQPIPTV